jgi:DNA/RNA-binding domain of Phe-tRNA-synthetase-like protein
MYFCHSSQIWANYPDLVAATMSIHDLNVTAPDPERLEQRMAKFTAVAEQRLAGGSEAGLPEIQAWRRVFATMGLKPTQYRCASEALLRRLRKDGGLPSVNPLVDLCNAASVAFAVPIAAFDVQRISGYMEVRYAKGDETYLSFTGETEHPQPGEVIFCDGAGRAHARRWSNRQSAFSAVNSTTNEILIVAEGLHPSAPTDMSELSATLAEELTTLWDVQPTAAMLSAGQHKFEF